MSNFADRSSSGTRNKKKKLEESSKKRIAWEVLPELNDLMKDNNFKIVPGLSIEAGGNTWNRGSTLIEAGV
ncbi:MAG: hypothetical protein ACE5J3_02265 [Methanosarcinales archaeon]